VEVLVIKQHRVDKEWLQPTGGFVQVGHDVQSSAMCKHRLKFQRDEQHSATEQTMNFNL
jgi:hypothetical protein